MPGLLTKVHLVRSLRTSLAISLVAFSASAQWQWSNPRPTGQDLLDLEFVNESTGFILSDSVLLNTTDQGDSWEYMMSLNKAKDIDVSGNVGFIVTSEGKMYKTTDSGASWQLSTTSITDPLLEVNVISADTVIIAAEQALYVSRNGGASFTRYLHPYRIISIHFLNSKYGFASCWDGKVIKTVNGGLTWSVSLQHSSDWEINDVVFSTPLLGLALSETGDVLRTTNGGATWTSVVSSGFASLSACFVGTMTAFRAGDSGNISKSSDGGLSWTYVAPDTRDGNDLRAIRFPTPDVGIAVGRNGRIMKSVDAGVTWTSYSPTYYDIYDLSFPTTSTGYAVGFIGQVLKTVNGGEYWEFAPSPTSEFLVSVDFVDELTGYAITADDLYKTTDGGNTWQLQQLGFPFQYRDRLTVRFVSPDTGYVSGGFNFSDFLLRTVDAGASWHPLSDISLKHLQFVSKTIGYGMTFWGELYKTTDGGMTWTEKIYDSYLETFHFSTALDGWVAGSQGTLMKTSDGGITWKEYDVGYIDVSSVHFLNKNEGYLAGETGYSVKIMRTIDGGAHWAEESKLGIQRPEGVEAITVAGRERIFVGGEYGVIVRRDIDPDQVLFQFADAKSDFSKMAIVRHRVLNNTDHEAAFSFRLNGNVTATTVTLPPFGIDTVSVSISSLSWGQNYTYRLLAASDGEVFESEDVIFMLDQILNTENQLGRVKVYPNPVSSTLFVAPPEGMQHCTITLRDLNGRTLLRQQVVESIDMSRFPAGMYILHVVSGVRNETLKIVKQD